MGAREGGECSCMCRSAGQADGPMVRFVTACQARYKVGESALVKNTRERDNEIMCQLKWDIAVWNYIVAL
jgi:hypothetical protein